MYLHCCLWLVFTGEQTWQKYYNSRNKIDTGAVSGRPGLDYACKTLRGHKGLVTDVVYVTSNDIYNEDLISQSSHPIIASSSEDKSVSLWNVREGKLIWKKDTHDTPVKSLAIVTHNALLASGDQGGTVNLWDVSTGQNTKLTEKHEGGVTTIVSGRNVFGQSKDDKKFPLLSVGCRKGCIRLWDVRIPSQSQHVLQCNLGLNSICYQSDYVLAASSAFDESIQLFDIRNLSTEFKSPLLGSLSHPSGYGVTCMCWLPSNQHILAAGYSNGDILLWDTVGRRELHRFEHHGAISALCAHGTTLISTAKDNRMKLWDTVTFGHLKSFEDHKGPITGLYVDAYRAMTCSRDYSIRVYKWVNCESSVRSLESRYTLLGGSLQRAGNGFEKVVCDFSSCVGMANDVLKAYSFQV